MKTNNNNYRKEIARLRQSNSGLVERLKEIWAKYLEVRPMIPLNDNQHTTLTSTIHTDNIQVVYIL